MYACVSCVYDVDGMCIIVYVFWIDSISTILYLYHHGNFSPPPSVKYMGGKVEVIHDFDSDTLSFRDLEEFTKKCMTMMRMH